MRARRAGRVPGGRRARLLHVIALVLRVLVILVSFELSGASVLAPELAACDESGEGSCTDCPLEKDGMECPPGCPNCHCSHGGGIGLPPVFEDTPVKLAIADMNVEQPPYEASVPQAPPLAGPYRPPRSLLTLS